MPTQPEMQPALITMKAAGVRLSLSTSKVRNMANAGELPVVRFGRAVRIPVAALDALVAEQAGDGDSHAA